MNRHLVVGASGQVGGQLLQALNAAEVDVTGTYYQHPLAGLKQLDIRSLSETRRLVADRKPQVIWLPASHTNVDDCELHPNKSFEINVRAVSDVVRAANEVGAKLVYFSSDYIFDGRSGPYEEDDEANPISVYGQHKLMAENEVAANAPRSLTIRTTVVYGWERQKKNFVHRLLDRLKSGKTIDVPIDQIGSPTHAPNLARSVLELVQKEKGGTYCVAGTELASRYEFACEAARAFDLPEELVRPVATDSLQQNAARPLKAGLVTNKAAAELSLPLIGYREGLRIMAAERAEGVCA